MSRYFGYFRNAVLTELAYRANYWLRILGTALAVFVQYYLWLAVYRSSGSAIRGYSLRDTLTYAIISTALAAFLDLEMRSDKKVRDGSIALSLSKPADWQTMTFWESLGHSVFTLLAISLPVWAAALALGAVAPPATPLHGLAFLVSLGLAYCLLFAFNYLVGLASFWTKAGWGFVEAQATIVFFFSGTFVPLAMYPGWLERITAWLPFSGMYNLPLTVYLGKVGAGEIGLVLLQQAAWLIILVAVSRRLWWKAVAQLTVQGG